MAYDRQKFDLPEAPPAPVDEVGMRRLKLIAALRDPSMWPEGFRWRFFHCESCGVGLLQQALCVPRPGDINTDEFMSKALGISVKQAQMFISPCVYGVRDHASVTPAMVADRLEAVHRTLTAAARQP